MKLTVEGADLLSALKSVAPAAPARSTIPILSCVRLSATAAKVVSVEATDMDMRMGASLDARVVERPGRVCIEEARLRSLVAALPRGAQVAIDATGGSCTISAGRTRATFPTLDADDFPSFPPTQTVVSFGIGRTALSAALAAASFAISSEETRYYLNGIYLHLGAAGDVPELRLVATDGHRLAKRRLSLPEGAAGMPGVIVPRLTVAAMRALLDAAEVDPVLSVSETQIRMEIGRADLQSKIIDGTFPDYERVIPRGGNISARIAVPELKDITRRVAIAASDKARAVKVTLDGGQLSMDCGGTSSAEGRLFADEMAVSHHGEIEIGFNSRYLLEVVDSFGGETIEMIALDAGSPVIWRRPDEHEGDMCVLMPMRV